MKMLTFKQIEKYASRPGVRRIAVENFLMSAPLSIGYRYNFLNLEKDTLLYNWNEATQNAIADGLEVMFAPEL